MKKICLWLLAFSLLTSTSVLVKAQDGNGSEILTNDKVITMVKAGLPSSIIVTKIHASKGNFDTSTDELIRLKKLAIPDEVIHAMVENSAGVRESSSQPAPAAGTAPAGYPTEIGVYVNRDGKWIDVLPEVVNWKTGGVLKSIASAGIVKGDVNGHVEGDQSRTRVGQQLQFVVVAPEGVSITEYQLLRLNKHKDNREFRTVTGGIFHAKGGATHDLVPFEGQKIASRTFVVSLNGLTVGEYGFLPPGALTSVSGASTLGKIYSFSVVTQQ